MPVCVPAMMACHRDRQWPTDPPVSGINSLFISSIPMAWSGDQAPGLTTWCLETVEQWGTETRSDECWSGAGGRLGICSQWQWPGQWRWEEGGWKALSVLMMCVWYYFQVVMPSIWGSLNRKVKEEEGSGQSIFLMPFHQETKNNNNNQLNQSPTTTTIA